VRLPLKKWVEHGNFFFFFFEKKPKREINLLIPTKEDCGVDYFLRI